MKKITNLKFRIIMTLTEGHQARFEYTDRMMAQAHYDQLRATMVCGGLAIKTIEFEKDKV